MSKKEVKQMLDLKFGQRVQTRKLTVQATDGPITFTIQGLSNRVQGEISGKPDAVAIANTVKYGLIAVEGWTDEAGNPVACEFTEQDILGKPVRCLTDDFVDNVPDMVQHLLVTEIANLTTVDINALDFSIA